MNRLLHLTSHFAVRGHRDAAIRSAVKRFAGMNPDPLPDDKSSSEISLLKVLSAQCNIFVIGTKNDLIAFFYDAMIIVAGIAGRFFAAPANGLNFFDFIGNLHQTAAAREKLFWKSARSP